MNPEEFERRLQLVLEMNFPYPERTERHFDSSVELTPAAVLILFAFPGPHVLFVRRADSLETHRGQMAFPGGRTDPEDLNQPFTTAVRETEEEVGIPRNKVRMVGFLPRLATITAYCIQPVVGILQVPLDEVVLKLDETETAEALWVPLQQLLHPDTYKKEILTVNKIDFPIDVFQVKNHRIWGATGSMTRNLLDRLNTQTLFQQQERTQQ